MPLRLAVCLLLAATWPAQAEPTLTGRWKSDAALSMRFNRERAKLGENALLFIGQAMGRQTLVFTATTLTQDLPAWEHETAVGTRQQMPGFHHVRPYRKLGGNPHEVAISSIDPVTGRPTLTLYNFDDEDTMWVYIGGASKAFPSSHLREYFVRMR